MRTLIRRVCKASVSVHGDIVGEISKGLVVYVGIHREDEIKDLAWIIKKLLGMRVFEDESQKLNLSIEDVNCGLLIISQFTLLASFKKGYRPSFHNASPPGSANVLYSEFIKMLRGQYSGNIQTGAFGKNMEITAIDDGPYSLWLDSRMKSY
jgi:D-aminoacyl-tRNA deacylase